ncbi:hypothetical protein V6N13_122399 [Hibiscus sabdariffa]
MQIASLGKARRQGGSRHNFCSSLRWMVFGEIAAQIRAFLVSSTGTNIVVSVPIPLWNPCTGTAILVLVRFVIGIGTYILVLVRIGFSIGTIIGVPVRSDTGIGTSFRVPVLAA